jgi:predicted permease
MGPDLEKGLWLPIQPTPEMQKDRGDHFLFVLGFLKPDVTLAQVQGELGAIAKHIREGDPQLTKDFGFQAASYQELLTGPVRPVLLGLTLALGLVLVIACLNVANLLIARCLGRQHEFAVRAALGAGQLRLMRQLFVEGALLSIFGCLLGAGLAQLAIVGVQKLPADTIPLGESIHLHWTVLLALGAIASITTLVSSLLPALLVARTDPQPALQGGSRAVGARSVRRRLSAWVVAAEVGFSVVLLIATGLLFRTLWSLEHARLGFDVTRVTEFTPMPANAAGLGNIGVSDQAHESTSVATLTYQPLLERMRHVPGVQDAALVTAPPFSGIDMNTSLTVVGEPDDQEHNYNAKITAVSGDYARLMGIPVIRGRAVTEDDAAGAPYIVVVNETFANMFLKGKDPIGLQLNLGGTDTGMVKPYTIVGVIGDQVDTNVSHPSKPLLMLAYQQIPTSSLFYPVLLNTVVYFVVKTNGNVAIAPAMRNVFNHQAPDFALDNFQTMRELLDQSNFNDRLGLYLIGTFAGLAVLMVVAGLYGVLAQMVSFRRREIGVRLALGATRQSILVMILRQGWMLIASGIVCGMLAAIAGGKLIRGFLFGVKALDAWTYVAVAVTLGLVGTVAALIPARKAASVDQSKL